ncbi:MAG: endonuclease V [Thermomicrobiales bacterium]|nr:MAG: endonuclease V [Thermomicrobiales bacterium]
MQAVYRHPWNVTVEEARAIQQELRKRVSLVDAVALDAIQHVGGIDTGYVNNELGTTGFAAVVVMSFPALVQCEIAIGEHRVEFPYVPGFLTFREGPPILAALERVAIEPDVLLIDGHGYAHPRRLGIATHIGVLLDRPTIGCAKSVLVGQYEEPDGRFGAHSPLIHQGEVVGAAVRTRPGHAPLFVSPGHKLSVATAVSIVLACCRDNGYLPVPTQAAHEAVARHTRPLRKRR